MKTVLRQRLPNLTRLSAIVGVLVCVAAGVQAATFTWTGGSSATADWTNAANWNVGVSYPGNGTNGVDEAIFPNGSGPTFTTMPAVKLYGLQTGNSKVTFCASVNTDRPTNNTGAGWMVIGTGGVQGTSIVAGGSTYNVSSLTVNGNVTATTFGGWNSLPVTTGSIIFDVQSFILPADQGTGTYDIPSTWTFENSASLTFQPLHIFHCTLNWTGTPTFNGGRPTFNLIRGFDPVGLMNLNAQTLVANVVTLGAWSADGARHSELRGNGATVDINVLNVNANGSVPAQQNFVNLDNSSIYIRGSGTAWNNLSQGNTLFDVRTNTTTTLDPAAGALSISTGSKDRGGDGVQPADWVNNFAFWNITLGTGDVITLTGNATIEGLGTSALYAHYLSGSGTIALNGHNVYLDEYPASTVLFTGSGTVYAIPEPASLALLGLAGLAGLARRRGRR